MAETFDLIVIGSGPGGYVAAIRASQLGLKTACIEKEEVLGGTCLNVGCIPSKALLYSTECYQALLKEAPLLGIEVQKATVDFKRMMSRKQKIVTSFQTGISALFKKNRITQIHGKASLISSTTVAIAEGNSTREISGRHLILATGSVSMALPFLDFDESKVLSSTGALQLERVPKTMLVVGAGIIGVELGSVYARLGSQVTFVELLDRICPTLDEELSQQLQKQLTSQGMQFSLSSQVIAAMKDAQVTLKVSLADGSIREMSADVALVCIGRKPNTSGLGLEKMGISVNEKGFVKIDSCFRTAIPNIFAIGDIVDGPMLAHKASEEAVAVAEIIAGHHPKVEYAAIPNVVYTYPEVAGVGMTESQAKQAGLTIKTGSFPFQANSRARCTAQTEGFVKMIAEEKTGRIVGIHILGAHASELIAEGALAIQKKATVEELASTPHAHPTLSEALKEAALATLGRAIHK
jgi:dihydrolipoamide dehydrogenase